VPSSPSPTRLLESEAGDAPALDAADTPDDFRLARRAAEESPLSPLVDSPPASGTSTFAAAVPPSDLWSDLDAEIAAEQERQQQAQAAAAQRASE
jgi:hypothetical protein